ncbi:hypothetical protein VDR99_21805, partial [Xanthomonas campestris pv. campestris]|nr:hypothetical protein [Xanthomonas campestris pv. campestris]
RQLHGSLLNMRRVVSRICGALFRVSLAETSQACGSEETRLIDMGVCWCSWPRNQVFSICIGVSESGFMGSLQA